MTNISAAIVVLIVISVGCTKEGSLERNTNTNNLTVSGKLWKTFDTALSVSVIGNELNYDASNRLVRAKLNQVNSDGILQRMEVFYTRNTSGKITLVIIHDTTFRPSGVSSSDYYCYPHYAASGLIDHFITDTSYNSFGRFQYDSVSIVRNAANFPIEIRYYDVLYSLDPFTGVLTRDTSSNYSLFSTNSLGQITTFTTIEDYKLSLSYDDKNNPARFVEEALFLKIDESIVPFMSNNNITKIVWQNWNTTTGAYDSGDTTNIQYTYSSNNFPLTASTRFIDVWANDTLHLRRRFEYFP